MRKGQFFARALGPRLWSRFSAKVIRGQGAVRQAGQHVHALALGRGRPVGPEGQEELDSGKGFQAQDLESNAVGSLLLFADNYNHTTNDFTTRGTERIETLK